MRNARKLIECASGVVRHGFRGRVTWGEKIAAPDRWASADPNHAPRARHGAPGPVTLLGGFGGEVALLGADLVAGIVGLEVDGAEGAVLLEVGGTVDEGVLAAKFFLDVAETDGHVLDFEG